MLGNYEESRLENWGDMDAGTLGRNGCWLCFAISHYPIIQPLVTCDFTHHTYSVQFIRSCRPQCLNLDFTHTPLTIKTDDWGSGALAPPSGVSLPVPPSASTSLRSLFSKRMSWSRSLSWVTSLTVLTLLWIAYADVWYVGRFLLQGCVAVNGHLRFSTDHRLCHYIFLCSLYQPSAIYNRHHPRLR